MTEQDWQNRVERFRKQADYYADLFNHERMVSESLATAVQALGFQIKSLQKDNASLQRRVESAESELYELNSTRENAVANDE